MLNQILATKKHMTQAWTKSGRRVPVTVVTASDCYVAFTGKKENRIVAGQGIKKLKNVNKSQRSQLQKAGLSFGFKQIKELAVETADKEALQAGVKINPSDILKVGDVVKVTGVSKGKGFTGVVKRHGFKGGPRTHGQSDRERAPGSIGSTTTPGRVYKNKRMAGRSGNANVTVLNMPVIKVSEAEIWIKGILPGTINSPLLITKTGEGQFEGLFVRQEKAVADKTLVQEEKQEEAKEVKEAEVKTEATKPEETKSEGSKEETQPEEAKETEVKE